VEKVRAWARTNGFEWRLKLAANRPHDRTRPGVKKEFVFGPGGCALKGDIGVGSGPSACMRLRQAVAFSTAHPGSGASFALIAAGRENHECSVKDLFLSFEKGLGGFPVVGNGQNPPQTLFAFKGLHPCT
jgi:hypothetical protein